MFLKVYNVDRFFKLSSREFQSLMEEGIHDFCWLVDFVALRPKSTAMVIAGRSVYLTTLFPGQA